MTLLTSSTPMVPNSIPTGTVRLNSFLTSSGLAAVARSQSRCGWPSSASRTAPPTHHVSKPASSSRSAMRRTVAGGLTGCTVSNFSGFDPLALMSRTFLLSVVVHAGAEREHEIDAGLLGAPRPTKDGAQSPPAFGRRRDSHKYARLARPACAM